MEKQRRAVISGTGSYIPDHVISGQHFMDAAFFENGTRLDKTNAEIIQKFSDITDIVERRYVQQGQVNSDIAVIAAREAIKDAAIDPETLDYIIFAHNFGDMRPGGNRIDQLPALAAKVKEQLGIRNPDCIGYDILFGCPGWVQGAIQARYYIESGDASRVLVIGSETLSRIIDPHDRDSMIFSDGAGAVIFEATEDGATGILSHRAQTYAVDYAGLLTMGKSSFPLDPSDNYYMKMNGRKLYEFAVTTVPGVVKQALDKAGVHITDVRMVLIHQANGKMDQAIMKRLFKLYGLDDMPEKLTPMTISWLGNSSVATIPTLLDLVRRGKVEGYRVTGGDLVVFASVGAGMHINAFVHRF
ncbi:3-oxoacyl-ACP synthase [Pedobacter yulinensis]|uniref:3-oxoacyl-ACP synthase n=1 Tax=Pedobacter yulinensis TaxID=2126353 RepID=A0A2T3HRH0_9SPHI|nr:ketoacyl-ACP synthase III [Pedobacter yulinensis]PST85042.1 3-oxoacyl-ACP synthase [Pedobacter yulinensis]